MGRRERQKKNECAFSGMHKGLRGGGSAWMWGSKPGWADREVSLSKQTAVCSIGTAAGAPGSMKAAS